MKEIQCGYRIADKLPKGEFKRFTCYVIDLDKGITILFNQCLPISLLILAEWEET
jgi:hypothetical protein